MLAQRPLPKPRTRPIIHLLRIWSQVPPHVPESSGIHQPGPPAKPPGVPPTGVPCFLRQHVFREIGRMTVPQFTPESTHSSLGVLASRGLSPRHASSLPPQPSVLPHGLGFLSTNHPVLRHDRLLQRPPLLSADRAVLIMLNFSSRALNPGLSCSS
jgi:hypothetical protein